MKPSQTLQMLSSVPLFSSLDKKHLEDIASILTLKSYKKNGTVFHEGDLGNALFILISGTVKISLTGHDGKETILGMIYDNDFFGEMSLLDGYFRSATITAVEESKALLLDRGDFIRIIKESPDTILAVVATLSRRLRKTNEKIASLTFFDSYGKVAKMLLDLLEENSTKADNPSILELPMTRHELASMTGISRETLNRIFNEFQIRKCLKVEGRKITILDEGVLRREVL